MPRISKIPAPCDKPATQKGMEERIAEMVMAWSSGRTSEVLDWLRTLGCKAEIMEVSDGKPISFRIQGIAGITCGLPTNLSAIDLIPQFGFILAGMYWPMVYPGMQAKVNKLYAEMRKKEKQSPTLFD